MSERPLDNLGVVRFSAYPKTGKYPILTVLPPKHVNQGSDDLQCTLNHHLRPLSDKLSTKTTILTDFGETSMSPISVWATNYLPLSHV